MLIPPSISNSLPTVNADSSEARKTTAWAISEGVPKRPRGTCPWIEAATAFNCASEKPSLLFLLLPWEDDDNLSVSDLSLDGPTVGV